MEKKSRQRSQAKIQALIALRKVTTKALQGKAPKDLVVDISKRFTRETKSMINLRNNLEDIESVIKQIKMATLCSHAKEIFPRYPHTHSHSIVNFKQQHFVNKTFYTLSELKIKLKAIFCL